MSSCSTCSCKTGMVQAMVLYWMLAWAHLTVAFGSSTVNRPSAGSPAADSILSSSAAFFPSRLHILADEVVQSERRGLSADATLLNRWRSPSADGATSVKRINTVAEHTDKEETLAALWTVPRVRQLPCWGEAVTCTYRVAYSDPFASSGVLWQLMLMVEDPSGGPPGPASRVTVKLFASLASEHWQLGEGVTVSGELELQDAPQDAPWRSHDFHVHLDRSSPSVGHEGWSGEHVLSALRRGRLALVLRLRHVEATWHSNSTHTEALVEREMWFRAEAAALASILGVRERFRHVAVSSAFANDGLVYTTYKYNGVQTTLRTQVLSMLVVENLVCHLGHDNGSGASRAANLLPEIFKAVLSTPTSPSESGAPAAETASRDGKASSRMPLLSSSGEDLRPYLRPCVPSLKQPSAEGAAAARQHAAGAEPQGNGSEGNRPSARSAGPATGGEDGPAATSPPQWPSVFRGSPAAAVCWAALLGVAVAAAALAGCVAVGKRPWPRPALYPSTFRATPMRPSLNPVDASPASSPSSPSIIAPGDVPGSRCRRAARRRAAAQSPPAAPLPLPAPAPHREGRASRSSSPTRPSLSLSPPVAHAVRETGPCVLSAQGSASCLPGKPEGTHPMADAAGHLPVGVHAWTTSACSSRRREQRRRRRQAVGSPAGMAATATHRTAATATQWQLDVDQQADSDDHNGPGQPRGIARAGRGSAAAGALPGGAVPTLGGKAGDALGADDVGICIVCMDAPRAFGFLHGHAVHVGVCGGCAKALGTKTGETQCPVCRGTVERMVAIYD